jgi:hypothetical protein
LSPFAPRKVDFPWTGQAVVTALRRNGPAGSQISAPVLAMNVAHELGHYFGSTHRSAGGDDSNIMTQGLANINNRRAAAEQIEEWHTKLARNLTRRRDRVG